MIFDTLVKALRKRMGQISKNSVKKETNGLPDGIDFDVLADLCSRHLSGRLIATRYVHLSGWKNRGAYRLILETTKGRRWQLVYKDSLYDLDQIPALKELPLSPGPPEYTVFSGGNGPLDKYLPLRYLCTEVSPQKHYRYLFEDLNGEYQPPRSADDILRIVAELSEFHGALSEWSSGQGSNNLLNYDLEFSQALQNYAQTNLKKYFAKHSSDHFMALNRHWQDITDLYASAEYFLPNHAHPIHGDFNLTNIFLNKSIPGSMKIVDWEWAGWGTPHADLVSLLKNQPKEFADKALSLYAERHPDLSGDEHRRFFYWCWLERGFLDASFLAAQLLKTSVETQFNVKRHIERSLVRIMQAYQELKA
jgi:hypothetical protein